MAFEKKVCKRMNCNFADNLTKPLIIDLLLLLFIMSANG